MTDPAGGSPGNGDVDGGRTILLSPVYDLTGVPSPRLSYWRWYSTGVLFNPTTDNFVVNLSSDGGATWNRVERLGQPETFWVNVDVAIADIVTPTSQVQVQFIAQDNGTESVNEAAVDDFMIYGTESVPTSVPSVTPGQEQLLTLGPAQPNPVRSGGATFFSVRTPRRTHVDARVLDVAGRMVATLHDGMLPAGAHRLQWDGRRRDGGAAAAGVYFVRLKADGEVRTRKVQVLR